VKPAIAIVLALAAESGTIAGTIERSGAPAVKICVENRAITRWLSRSESIATKLFAGLGISTEWSHAGRCPTPSPWGPILIRISAPTPSGLHPGALAYSRLGDNRVEVFFDRIEATVAPLRVPDLLGYVFAHEAAHILEGVEHHSPEGIMKARWNRDDYDRMYPGPLPFAPEDVALIRAGAAAFQR
jgi:hypothetical protein